MMLYRPHYTELYCESHTHTASESLRYRGDKLQVSHLLSYSRSERRCPPPPPRLWWPHWNWVYTRSSARTPDTPGTGCPLCTHTHTHSQSALEYSSFYSTVLYCVPLCALTFGGWPFLGADSGHHGHGRQSADGSNSVTRFLPQKKKKLFNQCCIIFAVSYSIQYSTLFLCHFRLVLSHNSEGNILVFTPLHLSEALVTFQKKISAGKWTVYKIWNNSKNIRARTIRTFVCKLSY